MNFKTKKKKIEDNLWDDDYKIFDFIPISYGL